MSSPASFRTRSVFITQKHWRLLSAAAAQAELECPDAALEDILERAVAEQPLLERIASLIDENRKQERKQIAALIEQEAAERV